MDLVRAPTGDNPVMPSLVEVEAVNVAETVALEESPSEPETDSDDSEVWGTLSHGEDACQLLRDEQLRDGLSMSSFVLLPPYSGDPRY